MRNEPVAAALCVLTAMAVIGFIDQFVRVLATESSLWTFHLLRSLMMWGIVLAWLALTRRRLRVVDWRGLAGRSVAISVAMILYFGALGFMPVAQATAGLFTAPLWILLFELASGGRVGPIRVAAVAVGFLGVVLVLSPDPQDLSWTMAAPVAAGAFYGMGALATRAWCAREGTLELSLGVFTCMMAWGLGGVLLVGEGDGYLTRGWVWPTPEVWGVLAMQAVGSLGAVLLLTSGYQRAEASVASIFEYSVLGYAALFGWLVWDDRLGPTGLVGLCLIAAAGAVVALRAERRPA